MFSNSMEFNLVDVIKPSVNKLWIICFQILEDIIKTPVIMYVNKCFTNIY